MRREKGRAIIKKKASLKTPEVPLTHSFALLSCPRIHFECIAPILSFILVWVVFSWILFEATQTQTQTQN